MGDCQGPGKGRGVEKDRARRWVRVGYICF